VITGGRKRCTRLLEAMQRAGVTPHLLITHRLWPEDNTIARDEATRRGWTLEDLPYPSASASGRIRQHVRQEMNRHSKELVSRMRQLAETAVFVQFEEIGAMQYALHAPAALPAIVSAYNVDSAVEAATGRQTASGVDRLRSGYRAHRLQTTEQRAAKRADLVVTVSAHDRDYFVHQGSRRAIVVPNGVDEELFALAAEPPDAPRVLFFGSYAWPANSAGLIRYLREVWPRVVSELPAAELRVAGSGPLADLRAAGAETRGVTICGFVPDLLGELAAARVVVAPIWFGGGTRIKVLEALASARPVVGTSIGVEHIGFEHDRHGLVADHPEDLAAATLRVLRDRDTARRYAHNARALAEHYRWSAMTAPLQAIYRELAQRPSGARDQPRIPIKSRQS
jgi:glycosyltransferase involved in cell wall biosynthesis